VILFATIILGVAGLFVLNTWVVLRETRRAVLKGINAGGRAGGLREDIVTEADVEEARTFDELPEEVS